MDYPLPTAEPPEIERVRALYRVRYRRELSEDEAKDLLERVMHFVYLTEVEDRIAEARAARTTEEVSGAQHSPA